MENLNDKPYLELFEFIKACGESFLPSYLPLVKKHKDEPYTQEEVEF